MPQRYSLIAVVALVCLALELFFTKVLSFVFWNHVVYLIISVALLGYGVSSTLISLFYSRLISNNKVPFIAINLVLFVLCVTISLVYIAYSPHHFSLTSIKHSAGNLLLTYFLLTLSFFFASNVIVYLFSAYPKHASALYGWDLVGAALGCVLFPILMSRIGALQSIFMLLALLCFVGFSVLRRNNEGARWPGLSSALAVLAVVAAGSGFFVDSWLPLKVDRTKSLGYAMNKSINPNSAHEYHRWDVVTRLDIVGSEAPIDIGWMKISPGVKLITFDGDAISWIHPHSADFPTIKDKQAYQSTDLLVPFFRKVATGNHLIIGLGGGPDIADALLLGAKTIHAVDINSAILDAMTGPYAPYSGDIFNRPQVRLYHSEGRAFLRASDMRYDLIRMTGVDTFTALSTGAYVLAENYLYTVESFREYFRHLSDDGVLAIHRWIYDDRPRETLRMFAIILEALKAEGIEHPERHVAIIRPSHWHLAPTFVRKKAFSPAEVASLQAEMKRIESLTSHRIASVYFPFSKPSAHPASPFFHGYADAFTSGRAKEFETNYPFDISPVTDDRPFFFNYYRLRDMFQQWNTTGPIQGYWAYFVFGLILISAAVAVAIFIMLPLFIFRREGLRTRSSGVLALYFACLGLGFIMIEITCMQKFALLLGHPMYSIATVMGGMLVCAGIGSHLSGRLRAPPMRMLAISAGVVIVFCLALASPFATRVIDSLLGTDIAIRVLATLGIVAIGAVPLGFFFPIGLSVARMNDERFIPWAWGINSGFTVIGSVCAVAAAMKIGFSSVLILGAVIYLIAVFSIRRFWSTAEGATQRPTPNLGQTSVTIPLATEGAVPARKS